MRTSPVSNSHRHAFTLVEMMVALSVLALLCTLYGSFFNNASIAWTSGEERTERRRNSRALTDYIAQELRGALVPVEGFAKLEQTSSNLQFLINPPNSQVPDDLQNPDSIFFQAPLATELSYGEVAEVGYFVRWTQDANQRQQPVLCRFFVNPSIPVAGGKWDPNPDFLIFDATDKNAWLSPTLLNALAPASYDSPTRFKGLFAENVIGMWIRSYGLDGQELPRSYDSRLGYNCSFSAVDSSGTPKTWQEKRYLPARVRISIAQIDSRHALRLNDVAPAVKLISQDPQIRDARQFMDRLSGSANANKALLPILQGTRAYSTEVQLANAR